MSPPPPKWHPVQITNTLTSTASPNTDLKSASLEEISTTTSKTSDRNFRKSNAVRKNGVNYVDSTHARISYEKPRLLQRQADVSERNAANVRDVLRGMSGWEHGMLYLMLGSEARSGVAVRFPMLSSKARSQVVRSIHEEGQLRRRKAKGGGSFNPYGSEGPMSLSQDCMDFGRSSGSLEVTESLKVRDLVADLLDPCYFNLAVWGSDGYRYRAPIRDGKLR